MEIIIIFKQSPSKKNLEKLNDFLNDLFNTDFHYSIEESINLRVVFNDN